MRAFSSISTLSFVAASALTAILATTGCGGDGGSGSGGGGAGGAAANGPVSGPADTHCAQTVTVDPNMCMGSGGTGGAGGMAIEEPNSVLYNDEGDDDDCKYHVKWSVMEKVAQNTDLHFMIELTTKADGKPVTGAAPDIEAFLDETHPAPNTAQMPMEETGGMYHVGPVQFDKAGKWTARFHFFEDCMDMETSPHGHVGFYVNVP